MSEVWKTIWMFGNLCDSWRIEFILSLETLCILRTLAISEKVKCEVIPRKVPLAISCSKSVDRPRLCKKWSR